MVARPSPASLGLAFLGCGRATEMHSRTLKRLGLGLRLHYASRDPARAARLRQRHRGAGVFTSYEKAIADPGIDVVLVTTPPALHLDQTVQALRAGKHVIVEKPAFLQPEDVAVVGTEAHRAGRRVCVAENYCYKPLRVRLVRLLEEGLIGEPLFLQINAVKHQQAEGWRNEPALAGGGALFEGGIHWIHLMSNLGLEVRRVTGYLPGAGAPESDRERSVLVVVEYAGGAVGTLSYSWEVPSPLRGVRISRIYGRLGSVTFESNGIFTFVHGRRTRCGIPGLVDIAGYRSMFRDFIDAIRTEREPKMTLDMAERDLRLVRDIYRSIAGRTPAEGRA